MGAKNLKAIAVRGSKLLPVFDLTKYTVLRSEANRALKQDNEARVLREIGTASGKLFPNIWERCPQNIFIREISRMWIRSPAR